MSAATLSPSHGGFVRLIQGKGITCPVCGHDHYCMIAKDGSAAICTRVSAGCATRRDGSEIKAAKDHGWLHRLKGSNQRAVAKSVSKAKAAKDYPRISAGELRRIHRQHVTAMSPARLAREAKTLGVTERALKAFGIGYYSEWDCCSFPMYDGDRKIVGMRLRWEDGRKGCLPGGTNGIFIPNDYEAEPIPDGIGGVNEGDDHPLLLLMPEGPTSSAAAYDLSFRPLGRPSSNGGSEMIRRLLMNGVSKGCRQEVVIVADDEGTKWRKDKDGNETDPFWPGWEGALSLARDIRVICGSLKVLKPALFTPDGVAEKVKDLRVYLNRRGHRGMFFDLMNQAEPATDKWIRAKQDEVEVWRRRLSKRRKAG